MKLRQWYAIHGRIEASPHPFEILESLKPKAPGLDFDFEIGDGQWRRGSFRLIDAEAPTILVDRWRPGEEEFLGGIDVEAWDEYLKGLPGEPHGEQVLRHIRNVRQTIFLRPTLITLGRSQMARICEQMCGYLASTTAGLIQVYQAGFFSPEGDSLFPYNHRFRLKTL